MPSSRTFEEDVIGGHVHYPSLSAHPYAKHSTRDFQLDRANESSSLWGSQSAWQVENHLGRAASNSTHKPHSQDNEDYLNAISPLCGRGERAFTFLI